MPEYVLRVEGVNFADVIDDTDDLSTRRGGGLLVLNASAQLLETVGATLRSRLQPVATGASVLLLDDPHAANPTTSAHAATATRIPDPCPNPCPNRCIAQGYRRRGP